jgi:TolB-like protein/Tfp pilus assembly protein PilF
MSSLSEPTKDVVEALPSSVQVRSCLTDVLSSAVFRRSARLARFLSFLVDQALAHNCRPLKEYTIGLEVFDRPASYDPRLDPIVRVEARRLRAKLREYYEDEGASCPILIEIPDRGYLPAFRLRATQAGHDGYTDTTNNLAISLVVLPLVSLEPSASLRSFAEGLTDEISSALSRVHELQLVARTSAFQFRDRPGDVRDIGAELDADYVFEGSVRKDRKRVRVLVQIASSSSGFRVWSGSYEQKVDSAFEAQVDIARRIVSDLKLEMPPVQKIAPTAEVRRTSARAILALYQKGRRYLNSRTNDGIRRSIECFQQVLERDATCALAYAGLADGYSLGARYDVLPPQESWRKARAAALDAIRIDCSLAEAHTALGFIELHYVRDTSSAEREFCTAIQLNPRYAPARQWYAWCLLASGRAETAIENIQAALDLDPLSPNARADLGLTLYFSRRYKDSIAECNRTLRSAPGFYRAHQLLGLNFLQIGEHRKAIEHFHFAMSSSGRNSRMIVLLAHAYANIGQFDDAKGLAAELNSRSDVYVPAIDFALLYSALGDYDRTFHFLEKAFLEDEGELIWLPVDPIHDRLRSDARFLAFLQRIGVGLSANGLMPDRVQ